MVTTIKVKAGPKFLAAIKEINARKERRFKEMFARITPEMIEKLKRQNKA